MLILSCVESAIKLFERPGSADVSEIHWPASKQFANMSANSVMAVKRLSGLHYDAPHRVGRLCPLS
jgi:hypothetical protein